ncbi:hypothetical protein HDU96_005029 [Phlyctochytrium bullatum]|nr:hypothetical protein HDU96_005029 [Phlyctochytrium bullatum]
MVSQAVIQAILWVSIPLGLHNLILCLLQSIRKNTWIHHIQTLASFFQLANQLCFIILSTAPASTLFSNRCSAFITFADLTFYLFFPLSVGVLIWRSTGLVSAKHKTALRVVFFLVLASAMGFIFYAASARVDQIVGDRCVALYNREANSIGKIITFTLYLCLLLVFLVPAASHLKTTKEVSLHTATHQTATNYSENAARKGKTRSPSSEGPPPQPEPKPGQGTAPAAARSMAGSLDTQFNDSGFFAAATIEAGTGTAVDPALLSASSRATAGEKKRGPPRYEEPLARAVLLQRVGRKPSTHAESTYSRASSVVFAPNVLPPESSSPLDIDSEGPRAARHDGPSPPTSSPTSPFPTQTSPQPPRTHTPTAPPSPPPKPHPPPDAISLRSVAPPRRLSLFEHIVMNVTLRIVLAIVGFLLTVLLSFLGVWEKTGSFLIEFTIQNYMAISASSFDVATTQWTPLWKGRKRKRGTVEPVNPSGP